MGMLTPTLQHYVAGIEQEMTAAMPSTDTLQKTVSEAMAYACEAGGKRLRPLLVLAFAELCGGTAQTAMPYACAIEMIHCYSLVHDDLPCMDNSLLRRGKPSVFAKYGEDMALLAGDGLLTRAFEWGLKPSHVAAAGADRAVEAMAILADAAGINGMVGGQTIDLESEGKSIDMDTLCALQAGKTGALLTAACEMGAVLGGADATAREAARRYGMELGLCFQIVDDILDVTSTAETLGKPVGADEENQKVTYVSLLGLEEAKRLARYHTDEALAALSIFDEKASDLMQMTKALLERSM